jgi:hypothetical protein
LAAAGRLAPERLGRRHLNDLVVGSVISDDKDSRADKFVGFERGRADKYKNPAVISRVRPRRADATGA